MLFMVCSIFYSLSYFAAYKKADDFILDQLDEMIMGEEMEDAFVDDNYNNERGCGFTGRNLPTGNCAANFPRRLSSRTRKSPLPNNFSTAKTTHHANGKKSFYKFYRGVGRHGDR